VSTGFFLELIPGLKTETGRAAWDQWDRCVTGASGHSTAYGTEGSIKKAVISVRPKNHLHGQGFGFPLEMEDWVEAEGSQSERAVGGGRVDAESEWSGLVEGKTRLETGSLFTWRRSGSS